MKTKVTAALFILIFSASFMACKRCWKCDNYVLNMGNGQYEKTGETELCNVSARDMNTKVDYLKNDPTDGWECTSFYK
ncbi:MAG: hypothetical protein MH137_12935 [Flavobacteriales bacterium]|nr:hypothetical protein [Flavobacteriales bacterium]